MVRMTLSPRTAPTQRSSGNTADNAVYVLWRGGIMITVKNYNVYSLPDRQDGNLNVIFVNYES